jgi:phage repressor protein C with HTH and peptisase S24 domain
MNERPNVGTFVAMDENLDSVGKRIRHIRKLAGLTQAELASTLWEETEVTRGAIGNWERDQGISLDNLGAISSRFGVSMDWLQHGTSSPPDPLKVRTVASRLSDYDRHGHGQDGTQEPRESRRPATGPIAVPPGRLPYAGKVAAGEWLDNDDFNQDLNDNTVPESVPRHPGYPKLEQMAWRVFGDSMNEAGILEGMWLVGASYADYVDKIGELDNGNYVVVERTRYQGAERELTVKEVQFARKGMRLIPRSTNEKHKEFFIPLDTDADPDRESVRILGVVLWAGRDLAPGAK